jgi:hypothetical protein
VVLVRQVAIEGGVCRVFMRGFFVCSFIAAFE